MSLPSSRPDASLAAMLTRSWSARGWLACALWPLSQVFRLLTALRRGLYGMGVLRSTRLPLPVIIVGNIFIGGTGKTPLTIWLVEALRQRGYHPGVIARGYGAQAQMARPVLHDSAAQEVGDEPLLIVARTGVPMVVGRDRVAAAQALIARHPEVDLIISDDGLQHYRLARDIEIVLSDSRGNGNGWLLPAGPLREAASRRRDFSVINTRNENRNEKRNAVSNQVSNAANNAGKDVPARFAMQLTGAFAEQLVDRSQRLPLARLPQGALLAAAGIGNPGRFFALLRDAGLAFAELPLPDHFAYVDDPFAALSAQIIVITEKDAVKCRQHPVLQHDPRIWVVPVEARIDAALAEQIVEKLRGYPIA